ncbi:apolipoprotein N-acyltransferase [Streptantibioticus ferralitis]|uniref:Apolipoprotein N-acyltransferase n=1 Tax=Streptantibioticus ferralitis TaxID=236510 RepID=A0ABT5Z8J7_9ACTN|nr:apolipoprotein N-acyltransferase [Streptantibioticus ferralitis]MDF2260153.1 apolipoprotein N-acyltransferase [Streptantibioticus ferralitis]
MPPRDSARRPSLTSPWWRGAAAVVAGALPALAFPAPALWWLAYVALVPLILLARSAPTSGRGALDGWLGGTGFMIAVHHWLLPSLSAFIVVIAALLGLVWLPWGWLAQRLLGGSPGVGSVLAALVLLPSAWLLVEMVRSWQYLGGPWGLLGASQWQVQPALRLASIGGVWLLSFLLVAVNTAIAALIAAPAVRHTAVAALVAIALGVTAVWFWAPVAPRTGSVRIAVVQPGDIENGLARFDRSAQLTTQLAGLHPDLVVWGESSVGFDLSAHPPLSRRLADLSRQVGSDLLVNVDAQRADGRGIYKTSVLVGPQGPTGDSYDKMRLVPFGEYIPLRSVLGWATKVGKAASVNRHRGTHQVVMNVGTLRIGPLICFETAFPDMSRHLADMGAQILVAQSSTSTFQDSWAPAQHASLAALRAAETWRPVVHSTLTGISAVYDARGTRLGPRLGTSSSTARLYTVPLSGGRSPYDRFGDWVIKMSVGLLLLSAVHEGRRAVRRPAAVRR